MIVFELECREGGHHFEGWFGSSEEFARQQRRGLVCCPACGGFDVVKAPMAPRLARKGNQTVTAPMAAPPREAPERPPPQPQAMVPAPTLPPEAKAALTALARMQAEALRQSRWVGRRFVDDARAMHYGEIEAHAIHGQATPDEARELHEEGVAIAPVLFPVAPPGEIN